MKRYQKGYISISTGQLLGALAIAGCLGWCIIELVVYVVQHIDVRWL